MQFSLFDSDSTDTNQPVSSVKTLPLAEADVKYYSRAIATDSANHYFHVLKQELPWRQDAIRLFGKSIDIPRLQSWHGDPQCTYTYSNLTLKPNPWTDSLQRLKALCETLSNTSFNCVLANWYRDGNDSMSFHADDEADLGINPTIASVTLGEARPFVFKHKESKATYTQVLEHGSVLIMAGTTQSHYLHGIAKTAKPIGGRINLTFRHLIPRNR